MMTTPQESIEDLRVALDDDAAKLAAKVLRLARTHDRAVARRIEREPTQPLPSTEAS